MDIAETYMKKTFLVLFATGAAMSQALAYPTTVHTVITDAAVKGSKLNDQGGVLVDVLDLAEWVAKDPSGPFRNKASRFAHGHEYFSMSPAAEYKDGDHRFEKSIMWQVKDTYLLPQDHSIAGLVIRGAIREDDNEIEVGDTDEPGGVAARPFGHFFDPVNQRGLTMGIAVGSTARDWALSDGATILDVTKGRSRSNNFNMGRLKEALWRALTGRTTSGLNAEPDGAGTKPASEAVRKAYWASTFRLLGNQVHLLQDMAQPQHTRNDAHSGLLCVPGTDYCAAGHDSFYEKYLHARATGARQFVLNEGFATGVNQAGRSFSNYTRPAVTGYDLPLAKFKSYADFYAAGGNENGPGLANYSNRGFYSAGTNHNGSYSLPNIASMTVTSYQVAPDKWYSPGSGVMRLFRGEVTDFAQETPVRDTATLTAAGAFNQFMEARGKFSLTLNTLVYDDMAALLVPRATGYTASFINFLFRGRIDVSLPEEGVFALIDQNDALVSDPANQQLGFRDIKVRLAAPSEDRNGQPQQLGAGVLTAVVKYRRNSCYDDALASYPKDAEQAAACVGTEQEIVVSDPANNGSPVALSPTPQTFSFNFPQALPINATNVRLQVIYKGDVNTQKDEIVVATQDLSEPTFFTYLNAMDYWRLDGRVYTVSEIAGNQALIDKMTRCVTTVDGVKRLNTDCMKPSAVNMKLAIGTEAAHVKIDIENLPVKRFVRLAMLGLPDQPVQVIQVASNCYPLDAINVAAYQWEAYYKTPVSMFAPLKNSRGMQMWDGTSCVSSGNAEMSGLDNREEIFSALNDAATTPDLARINDGLGYK